MAGFNLNIDAQISIPYNPNFTKLRQGDCLVGTTAVPLGITNDVEVPGIEFLFSEYTGANGWDNIRISNLSYTDASKFYLEYAAATLTPNVDPDIVLATMAVPAVATNDAIPTLFVKYVNSTVDSNEQIAFDIEVEDVLGGFLGKVRYGISLIYVECIVPIPPIVEVSSLENGCVTQVEVTVTVPPEGSRYVYKVESDAFSVVSGTLPATITTDTNYILSITADNSGPNSEYSVAQLWVKDTSTSTITIDGKSISRNHKGSIC
jgi:hypothetical protein